jgi:hypothetical protein
MSRTLELTGVYSCTSQISGIRRWRRQAERREEWREASSEGGQGQKGCSARDGWVDGMYSIPQNSCPLELSRLFAYRSLTTCYWLKSEIYILSPDTVSCLGNREISVRNSRPNDEQCLRRNYDTKSVLLHREQRL